MDLSSPSLTPSPSSPSNTYCPSERSLDYPSPGLVEQQYKLSPIYGAESACSLAPALDVVETSLPPVDAMSQTSEWGTSMMQHHHHHDQLHHSSSSAAAMPSIVSPEYSTFGGYDSMPSSPYGHPDVYHPHPIHAHAHAHAHPTSVPHHHTATPPPSGPVSRSPMPQAPRTPLSFSPVAGHISPLPGHMTARVKMETGSEYGQPMDATHYPSPQSVAYTTSPAAGYMSDSGSSVWAKSEYQAPMEHHEQYYSGVQDARRAYRIQRPRRAPRRLTTKEEANFQCEVKGCGKLFSRSYNFKAHMETHDDKREYPFPCTMPECNKKFVRKTDLQRHHSSVHAKERNHKCDYCTRMFARKDTLRRHMEDGCSKRFDIGTLDLRAESYDRPMGHIGVVSPPGSLPPMAIPPLASSAIITSGQSHSWGR